MKQALAVLLVTLFLAACGAAETPAPEPTRRPTRRPPAPAAATATPTAMPVPEPSPTPDPLADDCPLTGLKDTARPWLARRPLIVKIDNAPAARPQSGLSAADLVVEHLAEGGVTRFDAVYWCRGAEHVGPIRSGRLIDLDLVAMFQAVFVHVGASDPVLVMLRDAFGSRSLDGNVDRLLFLRLQTRPRPYNTYINTQVMWDAASQRGANRTGISLKGLVFAESAPGGGQPANLVALPYDRRFSDSTWEYVPEQKAYRKFLLGAPVVDAETGEPVLEANLVVVFASHSVTDIVEDVLGSRSIAIDLKGRGRAVIFRDGMAFEGEWVREDPGALIRFVDADGRDVALKPGRTWIEVVPAEFKLEWK